MKFKVLLFIVLLLNICSCKKKETENNSINSYNTSSQHVINIQNLQKSFKAKNEQGFLKQFPKDFKQFNTYFGWDSRNDEPEELYDVANDYINYWFELLEDEKYKSHESNIIKISAKGHWEPDAVNYFQDKALDYIKEKRKYYLINALDDAKARSVLFFLFDGPHPKYDEDFALHLNEGKKKILNIVFEKDLFDQDDIDEDETQYDEDVESYTISNYTNNDAYFSREMDINNDGILDKVISSQRYQGDELLLFVKNNNTYEFALKTSNFSQDGGNQIYEVKEAETGFVIVTVFPDGGFFESHYYVSFNNNRWMLTNTIYKTMSSNQEDAFVYECDVKQNVDLSDITQLSNVRQIPEEADRDRVCTIIKPETSHSDADDNDDISGHYELITGETLFIGSDDNVLYKAEIFIERLSETDFGFYSAYKRKKISPIGDFGIIRKYKNNYNVIRICEVESKKGFTKENFERGIYLFNQLIIYKKGDTLGVIRYGSNFRRYMLYKKKKNDTNSSSYLVKTLKTSKLDYKSLLSDYEKAINYNRNKLKIEQKPFNEGWVTKHSHKNDSISFQKTMYYQDPYQDGKFVKQDAIFLKQLYE